MKYTVERFDTLKGWTYYNTFESYSEAEEEAERLRRLYKKQRFEVFSKEE